MINIKGFNLRQALLGCLNLILSIVCCIVAWWFFYLALRMLSGAFSGILPAFALSAGTASLLAYVLVLVVLIAGFFQWKRGQEPESYVDSALNVPIEWVSGGAFMMDHYARRVTGPAYVLSRIFLGGTLQFIKGITRFHSLIPCTPELQERLEQLLAEVDAKKVWHPISTYAGREKDLSLLIRMDLIEFSARKGTVRTKQA